MTKISEAFEAFRNDPTTPKDIRIHPEANDLICFRAGALAERKEIVEEIRKEMGGKLYVERESFDKLSAFLTSIEAEQE